MVFMVEEQCTKRFTTLIFEYTVNHLAAGNSSVLF